MYMVEKIDEVKFDVRYYLRRRLEKIKDKPEVPEMTKLRTLLGKEDFYSPILNETSASLFIVDAILHAVTGLGPEEFLGRNLITDVECYGIHILLNQIKYSDSAK